MSSDRESELQPLIGDAKKQGGCCAKHPVLCASLLVFILVLSAVALVLGSVLHSKLDQTVQDAISDVSALVNCVRNVAGPTDNLVFGCGAVVWLHKVMLMWWK